jgi:hypothetical protein
VLFQKSDIYIKTHKMTFEEYKEKGAPEELAIDDLMAMDTNVKTLEVGNDINEIFASLLCFQAQLKVMHWGTASYAEHKAYMKTYDAIDGGLDSLVESYQGYNGRIDFGGSLSLISFEQVNVQDWLSTNLDLLSKLRGMCDKTDLQNMVDELIAAISRLMYLLTLK